MEDRENFEGRSLANGNHCDRENNHENVEEHPKELASMGIENAYANSHNVDRIMENIEQYKGNMDEMK